MIDFDPTLIPAVLLPVLLGLISMALEVRS